MKNKINLLFGMIFLIIVMTSSINAEIFATQNYIKDFNASTLDIRGNYRIDDTSQENTSNLIPVTFYFEYDVLPLPFVNIDNFGNHYKVDYCNLTWVRHNSNPSWINLYADNFTGQRNFGTGGEVKDILRFQLIGTDTLQVDMSCHYNNSASIYDTNIHVGSFYSVFPSYSCFDCNQYDYSVVVNDSLNYNPIGQTYTYIQQIVTWDWELWLILEWIVRILFIFIGIGLIFAGVYWVYVFISNLEREISRK